MCVCVSQCDFSRWKPNTSLERGEGVKKKKKFALLLFGYTFGQTRWVWELLCTRNRMKEKEEREGGTSNNGIATAAFAEFKATGFSERVRETRMRLGVVCLWPFSPFPPCTLR